MLDRSTDSESFRRRMISSIGLWLGLLIGLAIPLRYFLAPVRLESLVLNSGCAITLLLIPWLVGHKFGTKLCGMLLLVCLSAVGFFSGLYNGGINAPATLIFVLTPLLGFFCIGPVGARAALGLAAISIITLLLGEKFLFVLPLSHLERRSQYVSLIYFVGSLAAYIIGAAYERSRRISVDHIAKITAQATYAAKMASLGEMAAGIAHEINNPLAIISGTASLLSRFTGDPEKLEEKINSIQKSVNRISTIVSGLKKFSRTEERIEFAHQSLHDILLEALTLTQARAKQFNTDISCQCGDEIKVFCSEVEIEQVVVNLINNGIDATRGMTEKWVKIQASEEEAYTRIRVTDSGPRIPEGIRSKLFVPFFTTKGIGEGTGLGLSIAKGILENHHASIQILPDAQNTCFEIRFKKT